MQDWLQWYASTNEDEIAKGIVANAEGAVARIVVRSYLLNMDVVDADALKTPVQFVPLGFLDNEFDVAIYIPEQVVDFLGTENVVASVKPLIYLAGSVYIGSGPDAVHRLGWVHDERNPHG